MTRSPARASSVFIQLPSAPGPDFAQVNYRHGFRDWAASIGDPRRDKALIYTLDPALDADLKELWREWQSVEVRVHYPSTSRDMPSELFVTHGEWGRAVAADPFYAQRWNPADPVAWESMEVDDMDKVVESHRSAQRRVHLCLDLRDLDERDVSSLIPSLESLCVISADVPEAIVRQVNGRAKSGGLTSAGRPFGEAGTSRSYVRIRGPRSAFRSCRSEVRVKVGALLEGVAVTSRRVRDVVRSQSQWGGDQVDERTFGNVDPLSVFTRTEVETWIERVRRNPEASWSVQLEDELDVEDVARECHAELGVWPISFSYPAGFGESDPVSQLSPIIPGYPYAFTSPHAYLETYAKSHLALTFRKAGWDCFRHVEILASGSVPLMPDAVRIPRFSMVHYPKVAMARVATEAWAHGGAPDRATRAAFRKYFERHLTARAMARYLLKMSELEGAQRILFIDGETPVNPEYQSSLTLIGLKALLGEGCEVSFPAPFLYEDSTMSASGFYGRGFGYGHVLDPRVRTAGETNGTVGHGLSRLSDYDAVVIGSVSRNVRLTHQVLRDCAPSRIIAIHGEDGPPARRDVAQLLESGAHVFVRSIHN